MPDDRAWVQALDFRLSGSGVTSAANTITLTSFDLPGTTTNIVTADFGALGHGVLEPGTAREEIVSFTGVTQNADGTATLTGVTRGLDFTAPYTNVAAYQRAHAGGTIFRISNTAAFYNDFVNKHNEETITQVHTYSALPATTAGDPVADNDLARKAYVDTVGTGTAPPSDRTVVAGTAGAVIAAGNLIYFSTVDNEWLLTDADTATTVNNVLLGIAQGAGTNGNPITNGVLLKGEDSNQAGMTAGDIMYASNTAGAIANAGGTTEKAIGQANTATNLYFDPYFADIPTAAYTDALAGSNGTPSGTNQYVTRTGLQRSTETYAATSTGNDTYVVTLTPAPAAYVAGMTIHVSVDVVNTGACTINVNGLGARDIRKGNNAALATGDIVANQVITLVDNGTNFRLQNVNNTQFITQAEFQAGAEIYAATSTGNDTYVITLTPAVAAYAAGQTFRVLADVANTGAATLNVNGVGATAIVKNGNTALEDNDIQAGQVFQVVYDGTNFELISTADKLNQANATTLTDGSDADSLHTHSFSKLLAAPVTANTTVTNTNVETNVYSQQIDANTLSTNNAVRLRLHVSDFDIGDNDTMTIRCKYGATTLVSVGITEAHGAAKTNMKGWINFDLLANAATNAQVGICEFDIKETGFSDETAGAGSALNNAFNITEGTSVEDSTGNLNLVVSVQWTLADAANSITISNAIATILD